ncbi:hypothetical protein BN1088_1433150 [Sphingobacterium sp. PM2-P1-29]|nr:hypothetical protein BN1088_1433150 [Sphingobacterium sp. PM2-P1-29]
MLTEKRKHKEETIKTHDKVYFDNVKRSHLIFFKRERLTIFMFRMMHL